LTYKSYGKLAILVEWPDKIDENILKNVLNFKNSVLKNNIKGIIEVINTYNSLTVYYSDTIENIYNEILTLKAIYNEGFTPNIVKKTLWKIPVCYDPKFGLDLKEISSNNKLQIDAIIDLHTSPKYTIYFIGFLPGFLYLGGLNSKLHIKRKSDPRLHVDKGSVGIGGSQTGVYPQESAGGWNIIGNSPINFFDRKNEQPCFAKAGDLIQFVPIDTHQHEEIKNLVNYKRYKIEKEELND